MPIPTSITVEPSDDLFLELGNNTYDYKDLISELVDNSIAAAVPDQELHVVVAVDVNAEGKPLRFRITDDGAGISNEDLPSAISPASRRSTGSLNEHGLGMKQAVAALGKLEYLRTKTAGDESAKEVRKFGFGTLEVHAAEIENAHGTEISIVNPKAVVLTTPNHISRDLVPVLGARYRRFLKGNPKRLDLKLQIVRDDEILYAWPVDPVFPVYFHPNKRTNKPVISDKALNGEGWSISLTFGYAPNDNEEWDELELEKPSKFNPYHVSLKKQGLDVIIHDRVILFHQLSEIGIVDSPHPSLNRIRGEIDLRSGFTTAITKNQIIRDARFQEAVESVRQFLTGEYEDGVKDYLETPTYPDQLPETLLRDRLSAWLKNRAESPVESVATEYVVEGIEGYVDVLADDKIAYELKVGQANALDVYQLFMYLDVGDFEGGFLLAPSFTTGAETAVRHIKERHGTNIRLALLSEYPINHSPDANERAEYF